MTIVEQKAANAILLFFISKTPKNRITRLKLMKLLCIADRIHVDGFSTTISKGSSQCAPPRLVPSNTLNMTKQDLDGFFTVDGRVLEGINQFSSLYFSETDLSVMEEVWKDFGGMSSIQLRGLSHLFPEWKRFEKELADPGFAK